MSSAIFLLGMTPRTGTNFLRDLVALHPDCDKPELIWEDHLVHHSDLLVEYAASVHRHWASHDVDVEGYDERLCRDLGAALIGFLEDRTPGGRLLTKTPSVRNLDHFFRFFPDALLLILIRDGRSVVESGVRTFGWSYDEAARRWNRAASRVVAFDERYRDPEPRHLIVPYEELVRDLEGQMERILSFLELDPGAYDLGAGENLPVRGSSVFRGKGGETTWRGVEKTSRFDPLERWSHWDRSRHERFNWIAGRNLEALGYTPVRSDGARLRWHVRNRILDLAEKLPSRA